MAGIAEHVADVINKSFSQARITLRNIPASGNVGGFVIWDGFDDMDPKERQDRLWSVLRRDLSPDEQLQLSAIFTMTPEEFERTQDDE